MTFSETEFDVLQKFVQYLRPKLISGDTDIQSVFPPKESVTSSNKRLAFSSAYSILQKYETESGQKMSSRVGRRSNITNNRKKTLTPSQVKDLAKSMNHTVETADRYYDFTGIGDSVQNTLALSCSKTSTPLKSTSCTNPAAVPLSPIPSTSSAQSMLVSPKMTKRRLVTDSDESEEELEITVRNLRCKKIKKKI